MRNTNLVPGEGEKKRGEEDATKTQSFGPVSAGPFIEPLFCSAGLGRNFERKA